MARDLGVRLCDLARAALFPRSLWHMGCSHCRPLHKESNGAKITDSMTSYSIWRSTNSGETLSFNVARTPQ